MQQVSRQNFAKIFKKYRLFLDCFLRKRGLDECDREDLIQETFLRCYPLLQDKPEQEHYGLLMTTARNLHIDIYRQRKRQPEFADTEALERLASDTEQSQRLQRKVLIHELLQKVEKSDESQAFRMFYDEERGIREIANLTQTAQGTVASRIHRFRAKFFLEASHSLGHEQRWEA